MNQKLKDAIIKAVQDNINEFQLVNFITDQFKEYIYDSNGNYLVGGFKVAHFIKDFIKLYNN